jgi:serine/threonine protein kinase
MSTYAIIAGKMLQIGDQFDRYQIQAHMAQGGMSDIYRAYDLVNHREVVIKIPDQSMLGDPAQFERFQREMEVMGILDHPTILKGLGSGKYNRIPYLVTQFVDGRSPPPVRCRLIRPFRLLEKLLMAWPTAIKMKLFTGI